MDLRVGVVVSRNAAEWCSKKFKTGRNPTDEIWLSEPAWHADCLSRGSSCGVPGREDGWVALVDMVLELDDSRHTCK